MAKTVAQQPIKVKIFCTEYKGYLDEMPQEAKDALVARNQKAAKLFENK